MNNKSVYTFIEEGEVTQTLFLSDEQAAVFNWLKDKGYPFELVKVDTLAPEEITAEQWLPYKKLGE